MSEPQFPIYCKDESGIHVYMIISKNEVLKITNSANETSIALQDFYIDSNAYDSWVAGELQECSAKDFHFHRITINNRLISIGVSKEAQTTKSKS